MSRRLFSAEQLQGWSREIRAAMEHAADRQRRSVASALSAAHLTWDSPKGSSTAPLWSQADWTAALEADLLPASRRVARQIVAAVRSAAPARHSWGMPDAVEQLARRPYDRALAGGTGVARRMGVDTLTAAGVDVEAVRRAVAEAPKRYGGVVHPDSTSTIADAYQAAHADLADLVARVTTAMSNEAVTILTETATANTGATIQHVWNCAMLETSRPDHIDADGQTVDAGDTFDVGGEEAYYPGDPALSDEQSCNCLCELSVIGLEEAAADDAEAEAG